MSKYVLLLLCLFTANCKHQGEPPQKLRLITHNVYYGFTKISERKVSWMEWMREQQPDIVALQELNEFTSEQLQEDATHWGHAHTVLLKENGFPTGITSNLPIDDIQRITDGFHHGLIRVKINGIYIYVVHLHPSNWEVRHSEIDKILLNISQLPPSNPVILAGDFNTFAPTDSSFYVHHRLEPFFTRLDSIYQGNNLNQGKLDYGVISKVTAAGFIDLEYKFRSANYEFTGSFPAKLNTEGEHGDLRRLDYIFMRNTPKIRILDAQIIANDTTQYLSDHLPVIADFLIE